MIDYDKLIESMKDNIHRIGRKISYGIRNSDFQYGCLVGEAIAYQKILQDLRDMNLKELTDD